MKDELIIRVQSAPIDANDSVSWVLFNQSRAVLDSDETLLSELARRIVSLSDDFNIRLIVPGDTVLLTTATIPSKQLRQIKQALPYMVEEKLADNIEDVHLAIPAVLDKTSDEIPIAVARHSLLINWLETLHEVQLSPSAIVTETLCIPRSFNACSLLFDGSRVLYRVSDFLGAVFPVDQLNTLFKLLDQEHSFDSLTVVTTSSNETDLSNAKNFIQSMADDFPHINDIHENHYHENYTEVLATTLLNEADETINLLQGGYAVKKIGGEQSVLERWRNVALVASVGLAVYLVLAVGSGLYFNNKAASTEQEVYALYKQLFPSQRRIISPRKQMESYLRQNGGQGGSAGAFLKLLADAAQPLGSPQGNIDYTINQLRYNAKQSDLQLEVQSQSLENLDILKRSLLSKGLVVDISSATEKDNFIVGKLKVRSL